MLAGFDFLARWDFGLETEEEAAEEAEYLTFSVVATIAWRALAMAEGGRRKDGKS